MTLKAKAITGVAILALFDTVIPVPFTALAVIYVLLQRPPWAWDLMREVYGADGQ